eukprot:TRINITY_DN1719_c0_g2_i1.p1 TRINITY_DN1719_c0_g2~~TRINITY_DN1719_c0_g2_i1.p1  ORF type:complete len:339 (-),score=80.03 TRINITY_DN1719_c0_g2_i1:146-1105(-)
MSSTKNVSSSSSLSSSSSDEKEVSIMQKIKERQKRESEEKEALDMVKKKRQETSERNEQERTRRRWEKSFSSEDSSVSDDSSFEVNYCAYCGAYALVTEKSLSSLPHRQTDDAFVLDEKRNTFQRHMAAGPQKLIKRTNGVEKQFRLCCQQCGLVLAYRSAPLDKPSKYFYILPDALTNDPRSIINAPSASTASSSLAENESKTVHQLLSEDEIERSEDAEEQRKFLEKQQRMDQLRARKRQRTDAESAKKDISTIVEKIQEKIGTTAQDEKELTSNIVPTPKIDDRSETATESSQKSSTRSSSSSSESSSSTVHNIQV